MKWAHAILLVFLAVALSAAMGSAEESPKTAGPIDPLYQEVEAGMYFEEVPPATGPALTIDLGVGARVIIPPRFAEQRVREVTRPFGLGPGLEDPVVVGLQASVPDGPSQAFVLVYTLVNGQGVLKAELPLRQYFLACEVLTIDQQPVLAIHGASGAHFDDLWLYRFTAGKPELLLAQGSAAGVDLRPDPETGNPQVWVGVENWDDPEWDYASGKRLWNVYTWGGKQFALNPQLGTAPLKTAEERAAGYVAKVKSYLEEKPGDGS